MGRGRYLEFAGYLAKDTSVGMQLRKGPVLFWPPVGSSVLYYGLFCVHSPGFAKKTFISYSLSFKESFRQGLVVEIDLKNQTVLLEDGEVSMGADLSICWLQEAPGGRDCWWEETWVGVLKGGKSPQ